MNMKLKNDIEKLKKEVSYCVEANHASKVTATRGRLIKKLMQAIKELEKIENKTDEESKILEGYYNDLVDQTFFHKMQLKDRYSKEFLNAEAKVPDIITTLPKGLSLQFERIENAITELKSATTMKAKMKAIVHFGKELGLFVSTPVIFTGKFIIEHWYLLLLLLPRLHNWFKNKDKDKEKTQEDGLPQEQEQEVTEFVLDKVKEEQEQTQLVPNGAVTEPEGQLVPAPANTDLTAQGYPSSTEGYQPQPRPAIDYKNDPRFQAPKEDGRFTVEEADPSIFENSGAQVPTEVVVQNEGTPVEIAPVMSEEEKRYIDELNNKFLDSLESDYGYVVGSRHPDVTVVHNAEEYVDYVLSKNPGADINVENAKEFYEKWYPNQSRIDQDVIWPEVYDNPCYFATEQEFAEYLASGENMQLNAYYQNFVENGGNMDLFSRVSKAFEKSDYGQFLASLGFSGSAALVLFSLYEAGKYALAAPTGGVSLVLP